MTPANERKAAERKRRKDAGLVRVEAWVPADKVEAVREAIARAQSQTADIVAPNWLEIVVLGSRFEQEIDTRAPQSAPPEIRARYRPRPISGQREPDWLPGIAPKPDSGG